MKVHFYCENCGVEVRIKDKICPKCGRFFSQVRCPSCGYQGDSEHFIHGCPQCGHQESLSNINNSINTKSKPIIKENVQSVFPSWFLAVFGVIIFIIFIAVAMVYFVTN